MSRQTLIARWSCQPEPFWYEDEQTAHIKTEVEEWKSARERQCSHFAVEIC